MTDLFMNIFFGTLACVPATMFLLFGLMMAAESQHAPNGRCYEEYSACGLFCYRAAALTAVGTTTFFAIYLSAELAVWVPFPPLIIACIAIRSSRILHREYTTTHGGWYYRPCLA